MQATCYVVNVAIVNHTELLNVDADVVDCNGEELIGSLIPFSHACSTQLAISNVVIIAHGQLPAGYVRGKAQRINEMIIGTRLR